MKRYKELKYNKKTFTEQWEIKEILFKEGFQWFLDCEVEDVRIQITKRHLIFNSGTFFNGNWKYGVFRDGVWKYGTWEGGVWYNGKWYDGIFKSGIIFDGKFFNGKMESGEIKGGEFYHMEISKDVKKNEEKKEEVKQNYQTPQGEKISENMKTKKNVKSFNEFKVNEEFDEIESELKDENDLPIDEFPDEKDLEVLPPKLVNPVDRVEQWKNLSSNPGGRKIYKTMNDYLNSIGVDTTKHEDVPEKITSTRRGIRRKK